MDQKIYNRNNADYSQGKGDKITFKGRDYYDLIWYLQKGVKPNLCYIKALTKIADLKNLFQELDKKIKGINLTYLKQNIENLFESKKFSLSQFGFLGWEENLGKRKTPTILQNRRGDTELISI